MYLGLFHNSTEQVVSVQQLERINYLNIATTGSTDSHTHLVDGFKCFWLPCLLGWWSWLILIDCIHLLKNHQQAMFFVHQKNQGCKKSSGFQPPWTLGCFSHRDSGASLSLFCHDEILQAIEQGVYVDLQNSTLLDEEPARLSSTEPPDAVTGSSWWM